MSTETTQEPLLAVEDLNVAYGPIQALFDVTFSVGKGQIVAILGANGAGKTTTLRAISGFLPIRSGTVRFGGADMTRNSVEKHVAAGMSLVADNRLLFPTLTVDENLRAGGHRLSLGALNSRLEWAYGFFPVLRERRKSAAGSLSGGQAQMLAIGRGLMSNPELLVLDEPSQGLAPKIVAGLFGLISRLSEEEGLTILLVEQNTALALDLASYGYVISNGHVVLKGATNMLRSDDSIRRLYLGG